ncbi:fungal-specific transcription factor domain-containing protein [Rhodocollybia butyracea]|uniref:Fungal-specific transcription factor domain-containing protein n=1 Tax=Rhodocollybia butyracea TaxID=206335 RepID=A0A9P5Q4H9_9AGAR|nr:fungal-specific transcription factor domain-containing protein [Rhodocollybia butyracea]
MTTANDSSKESRASTRKSQACDACRARKIKCEAPMPGQPCSGCRSAELECKFTYTRKKRRPNLAPRSRNYGVDTAQVLVDNIISSLDEYSIPQDPDSVREMLISLAKYARSLEIRINRSSKLGSTADLPLVIRDSSGSPHCRNKLTSPNPGTLSETSDKEESDEDLLQDFRTLSIGTQERHFGRSSNYLFLHSAMEYRGDQMAAKGNDPYKQQIEVVMRPEMWVTDIWKWAPEPPTPTYTFPPNDLLFVLIDIYFHEISPYYFPLLHRPTFERSVLAGHHLADSNFGAVVLAVCALASRHSDDPRNKINPTDYEQLAGWKWFRQIQLVRPSFVDTTSIHELQLYCLACSFLSSTTVADACWPLVGLGLRLAQERGIHRSKPGKPRTPESEQWLRAFWCLNGLDILIGSSLGRPLATTANDFDVDQIAECDDEYWDSSTAAFVQPPAKPSALSFGVYLNKLLQIAASIQRTIYAVKRPNSDEFTSKAANKGAIEWNQRQVIKHDSALNEWLDSLPENLRWDPHRGDAVFFSQSVMLHTTFYFVQTTLHKKFVMKVAKPLNAASNSGSSPESATSTNTASSKAHKTFESLEMRMSFPSLAVCANAARCSVNISQAHHRRGLPPLGSLYLNLLANTAGILLVALWRSKHSTGAGSAASRKEHSDLQKCFAILTSYERRNQSSGRIVDKFSALAKSEELDTVPEPPHPSRKRRSDDAELDTDTPSSWSASPSSLSSGSLGIPSQAMLQDFGATGTITSGSQSASTNTTLPSFDDARTQPVGSAHSSNLMWSSPEFGMIASPNGTLGEISAHDVFGVEPVPVLAFDPEAIRNQTRPLENSELRNGLFDELYQFPENSNGTNAIGFNFDDNIDLDDWTLFMRNVDDALFEVGVGR